jgi:hypothetical protein
MAEVPFSLVTLASGRLPLDVLEDVYFASEFNIAAALRQVEALLEAMGPTRAVAAGPRARPSGKPGGGAAAVPRPPPTPPRDGAVRHGAGKGSSAAASGVAAGAAAAGATVAAARGLVSPIRPRQPVKAYTPDGLAPWAPNTPGVPRAASAATPPPPHRVAAGGSASDGLGPAGAVPARRPPVAAVPSTRGRSAGGGSASASAGSVAVSAGGSAGGIAASPGPAAAPTPRRRVALEALEALYPLIGRTELAQALDICGGDITATEQCLLELWPDDVASCFALLDLPPEWATAGGEGRGGGGCGGATRTGGLRNQAPVVGRAVAGSAVGAGGRQGKKGRAPPGLREKQQLAEALRASLLASAVAGGGSASAGGAACGAVDDGPPAVDDELPPLNVDALLPLRLLDSCQCRAGGDRGLHPAQHTTACLGKLRPLVQVSVCALCVSLPVCDAVCVCV